MLWRRTGRPKRLRGGGWHHLRGHIEGRLSGQRLEAGSGWHLHHDIRPSHFLGVHAQQLIPLWGLIAERYFGSYGAQALGAGSALHVVAWGVLTWMSLGV